MNRGKIGLVLGGGSARGWAHIGVLRQMEEMQIPIDFICGTSIGALVGGAWAMGKLDLLEEWVCGLQWNDIPGFLDFRFRGGLVEGRKLFNFFGKHTQDLQIEDLPVPFGAVAMDLDTGHEIWLRHGSLFQAVRSSISIPGFFNPVWHQNRWLVDGGTVNPVPVTLCRAMGADTIIAVELTSFAQFGIQEPVPSGPPPRTEEEENASWWQKARSLSSRLWGDPMKRFFFDSASGNGHPAYMDVISQSILVMQSRITRSRLAVEPPDLLLTPRVQDIGVMEFYRANEIIELGRRAVQEMASEFSNRFTRTEGNAPDTNQTGDRSAL